MKLRSVLGLGVVVACACIVATPALSSGTALFPKDKQFLVKTHQDNRFEMQLGRLAVLKGSTAAVRDFGDRVVRDHQRIDIGVKSAAAGFGVVIGDRLSRDQIGALAKVSKLTGKAFDQQVLKLATINNSGDHRYSADMAKTAKDPLVRGIASQHAAVEHQHFDKARQERRTEGGV